MIKPLCTNLILTFLFLANNYSQEKNCYMQNITFNSGEKLSYVISYNWFVVFAEVGLVDFTVKEDTLNGQEIYHFHADGRTFNMWDKFFKVRDTYETWVRKDNLRPLAFERNTREGDYSQNETYRYEGDSIVYRRSRTYDNPFSVDTLPTTPCSYDVMSALLYTRNLDYSNFKIGQRTPLSVVLDDESYEVFFQLLGIENKKIKGLGTFECLKFTLQLVEGTVFREGEDMLLWVTNDKNHIPIYLESPIIIGSVKGRITGIKGNRHPLSSKIN